MIASQRPPSIMSVPTYTHTHTDVYYSFWGISFIYHLEPLIHSLLISVYIYGLNGRGLRPTSLSFTITSVPIRTLPVLRRL